MPHTGNLPSSGETGPDEPAAAPTPLPVVLVGSGLRAQAWLTLLQRSARLQLVATVGRGESFVPEIAHHRSLSEAIAAYPDAAFAVTLPPRSAAEAALALADAARRAVVEAPLDDAVMDSSLGPGARGVRVAHGWVTLPGRRVMASLIERSEAGHLSLEIAGLPEEPRGDLDEILVHSCALIRHLMPEAKPRVARLIDQGTIELELESSADGGSWQISARLRTHGQKILARLEGSVAATWSWEANLESLALPNGLHIGPKTTRPPETRALAQLLFEANAGDGLDDAIGALRLARACRALLPHALPLTSRALRQSATLARRRPDDVLGYLGLRGELPAASAPVAHVEIEDPPQPFELGALLAGIKPVAFLTLRPTEVDGILKRIGDLPYERRERRVSIEAQDRWVDQRDLGEPRVELYISRERELARRAASLQTESDPSAAVRQLGELMGYPACCVEAFARQQDRSNNTANRYLTYARGVPPDGTPATPWPWQLNNLHTVAIPFYPCSYQCEAALAWASVALTQLERDSPDYVARLRGVLGQPVLYFDHQHQLILNGAWKDGAVHYRSVVTPTALKPELARLASALASSDELRLDQRALTIFAGGQVMLRLPRTDPALGLVAPFES